jgi:uncharacterized protein YecE (DUF72 family)
MLPAPGSIPGVTLYLGTSGWAYPEWRPAFYPQGLPQTRFLSYYGERFTACEVNATHYKVHSQEAVASWAADVPPAFRFAAKAHRRLTHARVLPPGGGGAAFLERFLESLIPLGDRLGVVLIQFPPTRERDDRALGEFLACLPAGLALAVEFRHESWIHPAVEERVAAAGGTLCFSEFEGRTPPERLPDGPLAYVRLRGEHYDDEARAAWLELLTADAARRPVFAFAKHEGAPAGDPHAGVGLAEWLVAASAGAA